VDLNGDGKVDILSGSYSRDDGDMAGLFQVLWGIEGGGFRAPAALNGSDGKPLIIAADKDDDVQRICTRPTAVDLNGDGKLEIVSGNFNGTFAWFLGEGEGRFAPGSTVMTDSEGSQLLVDGHSDPFFVDWDGDGDLDLISGSSAGGVSVFANDGSKTKPKFGKLSEPVPAVVSEEPQPFGDAWLRGPQSDTRVWADDINGDGKLDLLVGDTVSLLFPAEGLEEAAAREKLAAWSTKWQQLMEAWSGCKGESAEADRKKIQEDQAKLRKEREKIVRDDDTGFVWVMYRK